ncbi:OsmC family protein [Candidatus Nitrospira bockiana]
MEVRSKVYTYRTSLKWTEAKKGTLSSAGKPDLQVATPPEFKGHAGIWSPEDLFVASITVCIMSTFLAFAERAGLGFQGYESEGEGRVELVDGALQVTSVAVKVALRLAGAADADRAKELMEKAERHCLISRSVKSHISLDVVMM